MAKTVVGSTTGRDEKRHLSRFERQEASRLDELRNGPILCRLEENSIRTKRGFLVSYDNVIAVAVGVGIGITKDAREIARITGADYFGCDQKGRYYDRAAVKIRRDTGRLVFFKKKE